MICSAWDADVSARFVRETWFMLGALPTVDAL